MQGWASLLLGDTWAMKPIASGQSSLAIMLCSMTFTLGTVPWVVLAGFDMDLCCVEHLTSPKDNFFYKIC